MKRKQFISGLLSAVFIITTVFCVPMNIYAGADDSLFNFDCSEAVNSGSGYYISADNGIMKFAGWSNIELRDDCLYNQNGYAFAKVNNMQGEQRYRIEFKVKKDSDEQINAALLSMGTNSAADGITDENTANIIQYHADGRLFVAQSDKGYISAMPLGEYAYYTLLFDNDNITITLNGQIIYTQELEDSESELFSQASFISLGTQASQDNYGYYTGNIDCSYYFLRAYSESEKEETVGKISVSPVIYTHGYYDGENDFMMYGTSIADGSNSLEERTEIILPYNAALNGVYVYDNENVTFGYDSSVYYLTGSFSQEKYKAEDNKELYITIRFDYTLNNKPYCEYHRLCVKTNPVPVHAMLYTQAYRAVLADQKRVVAFQTAALGSSADYSTSPSYVAWGGDISHSHNANSWNILNPYSSSHAATNSSNGTITAALIGSTETSPVDKTSGYAVTGTKSGGNTDTGIYTMTANYYVDKSASTILGAHHKAGDDSYYIEMKTENLYQSFDTSANPVSIVQHQCWNNSLAVSNTSLGDNCWDANRNASETVRLTGSISDGNISDEYWSAATHSDSTRTAKGTVIVKFNVNVFDKTQARDTLSGSTADSTSSKYDPVLWRVYRNAYLNLEAQLNNYELSEVEIDLEESLKSIYSQMDLLLGDYSALDAIAAQCRNAIANKAIYKDTEALEEAYNEAADKAYDSNGKGILNDQKEIDEITCMLITEYTETVLNRSNVCISLTVFKDGTEIDKKEYSVGYAGELTLDADEYLTDGYGVDKWSEGNVTLSTSAKTFTVNAFSNHDISCYLTKDVNDAETKKIILLNKDGSFNMYFCLNTDSRLINALETAELYSKAIINYRITGWAVNSSEEYDTSAMLCDFDEIVIRPLYSPDGFDYSINVSGGVSQGGYEFDAKANVYCSDEDFLCWIVRYDDNSYRLVSYNKNYSFYVSGNMDFIAVTEKNYNTYKDKILSCPTPEQIAQKLPVVSMRGPAEDSESIYGVNYDSENHKITLVCQVSDGSSYTDCGAVIVYNGKTLVTHSVSQTSSNQYLMSYKIGSSFYDRTFTVRAYTEYDNQRYYSEDITFTVEGDSSKVDINKGNIQLTYDLLAKKYSVYQDSQPVLTDVGVSFKLNDTVINTDSYSYQSNSVRSFSDALGYGTELTVCLKSSGKPNLIQIFKIYQDKPFIITQLQLESADDNDIQTNYICPVDISNYTSICGGKQPWSQFLKVPFDNDGWVEFENAPIKEISGGTSHEVTAIYDAVNEKGLVIGSVTHDIWKTGIDFSSNTNGISSLKVYSGAGDELTRGEIEHGTVSGKSVASAQIFIGNYDNWQDGLNEYAESNELVTPSKQTCDQGVPFGWNSWGSVQTDLNYSTAVSISDYISSNLQSVWQEGENVPVYIDLDSYWDMLSEEELKAFAQHCKENKQIPGIYWAPFVTWYSPDDLNHEVPGTNGAVTFEDIVLRKYDGTMYSNELDGCIPLDITNPYTKMYIKNQLEKFKSWGFEYIKLDFLVHGSLEGLHYDSSVQTGIQAYNMGMSYINEIIGDSMFINLAMSPIFPHQYANGRRISCDVYYDIDETKYALNALTYGFWEKKIYKYPDPDHTIVWGKDGYCTQAEARSQVTLAAICGTAFITGDNFADSAISQTVANSRYDAMLKNSNIIALAKTGKVFTPIVDQEYSSSSNVYVMKNDDKIYYAVFNFNSSSKEFTLSLEGDSSYSYKEYWNGDTGTAQNSLTVKVSSNDSKIFEFSLSQ